MFPANGDVPLTCVTPTLSTPFAKSAGLFVIFDQFTAPAADANSAFGVGVNSCRGDSVVNEPVLAPDRTPSPGQRAFPAKGDASKSRFAKNRPFEAVTSSTTIVEPT